MRLVAERSTTPRRNVLSAAPGTKQRRLLCTVGDRLAPGICQWSEEGAGWEPVVEAGSDPTVTSMGVVFVREEDSGSSLWLAGNVVRRITEGGWSDRHAAGRPGAREILFSSDRDGGAEVYIVDPGRPPLRLTEGAGRCITPAWSPDGSRIAFASDRDGLYEIYTMAADGTDVRKMASAYGHSPAWSPDGATLAYAGSIVAQSARSPKPTSVCLVPANGGEPQMILGASMGSSPAWWGPDGATLAFVRNGWLFKCEVGSGEVQQLA